MTTALPGEFSFVLIVSVGPSLHVFGIYIFQVLTSVKLPRCYKPAEFKDVKSIELHHFADASVSGYGTASYLRFTVVKDVSTAAWLWERLELTTATLAVDGFYRRATILDEHYR